MDTLLSTLNQFPILKHNWRHTDCGMNPLSIVKLFNFLEKLTFSMRPVVKVNIRQPFGLQCSEKRFRDRVVPTVSLSAHVWYKPSSPSTARSFLPEESANRTASRLNVLSCVRLVFPIDTPPRIKIKYLFGSWSVRNREYGSVYQGSMKHRNLVMGL